MAFDVAYFGILKEELPPGWRTDRLGSIAEINPEQVQADYPHAEIQYLDISGVSRGCVGPPVVLPLDKAPSRARRIVKSGDTILSTVRPGNRAYAYLRQVPRNLVVSTGFAVLRAKSQLCEPRFLYYLSTSDPLIKYLASIADERSAYPSVNPSDIADCIVPIPPLPQQRAIARILGTLDDKIELNRRMNETLEVMARAIFKAWFVDFEPVRAKMEGRWRKGQSLPGLPAHLYDLFPERLVGSELGEIPEGWEVGCLDDEFDLTMGQSPPGETYNEVGEGTPFYQGRMDFGFRFPSQRVYCTAPTRFVKAGDTLVSIRAPVGDINMALEDCAIGRGLAAARHRTGTRSYTYYYMSSIKEVFKKFEAEGTVFGSITKKDFRTISCVIPPRQVVLAYEMSVSGLDDRIEINERQSRTLAILRDALLPKLVSGRIWVKDAGRFIERVM